jgi:hypothetical protein
LISKYTIVEWGLIEDRKDGGEGKVGGWITGNKTQEVGVSSRVLQHSGQVLTITYYIFYEEELQGSKHKEK